MSSSCCHKINGHQRNLVVCIDGTSNKFGENNTNVVRMYESVLKEEADNQLAWYNPGIGTYASRAQKSLKFLANTVFHTMNQAVAWDVEKNVQKAYKWLSDNYRHGDCIYLFGFSRGAFQVRILAGMIEKVGLVRKDNNATQIEYAYQHYLDPSDKQSNGYSSKAEAFKQTFCYKNVRVHFVGAWDTVSSVALTGEGVGDAFPQTINGMQHVCYFRHALALDERRVKFMPEYAYGGEHLNHLRDSVDDNIKAHVISHTKEVWFAGTHSDVGGSTSKDAPGPALMWMLHEAGMLGLRTENREFHKEDLLLTKTKASLASFWVIFELIPFARMRFSRYEKDSRRTKTYKPHFGAGRVVYPGQKIHASVLDQIHQGASNYKPKAVVYNEAGFWNRMRRHDDSELLKDKYITSSLEEDAKALVEKMSSVAAYDRETTVMWQHLSSCVFGQQALYDVLIDLLERNTVLTTTKDALITRITLNDIMQNKDFTNLRLRNAEETIGLFADFPNNVQSKKAVHEFMLRLTNHCKATRFRRMIVPEYPFLPQVLSAISGDGKWLLSSSESGPLILSKSPAIAAMEASGGGTDKDAIQLNAADEGSTLEQQFFGEEKSKLSYRVTAVATSYDGKLIAACYDDNSIIVWDTERHDITTELAIVGQADASTSLAFSRDGKQLVSGSTFHRVRIWDLEKRINVKEFQVKQGKTTAAITAVAFSHNDTRILYGSEEGLIGLFTINGDSTPGSASEMTGHTGAVTCIAALKDSRWLVSGSEDSSMRVWDLVVGKQVGPSLHGHRGTISSVVVSDNDVVSSSSDGTLRIWDVKYFVNVDPGSSS